MTDRILNILERIQSAQIKARSSSALNPVLWLIATCTTSAIASACMRSPAWLTTVFGAAAGLSVVVALGLAIYFAIKMPEALRSERYAIQKMAIERGAVGDSVRGLVPAGEEKQAVPRLPERTGDDA